MATNTQINYKNKKDCVIVGQSISIKNRSASSPVEREHIETPRTRLKSIGRHLETPLLIPKKTIESLESKWTQILEQIHNLISWFEDKHNELNEKELKIKPNEFQRFITTKLHLENLVNKKEEYISLQVSIDSFHDRVQYAYGNSKAFPELYYTVLKYTSKNKNDDSFVNQIKYQFKPLLKRYNLDFEHYHEECKTLAETFIDKLSSLVFDGKMNINRTDFLALMLSKELKSFRENPIWICLSCSDIHFPDQITKKSLKEVIMSCLELETISEIFY